MSFLSDVVDSISGDSGKRVTGQALVEVGKEFEDTKFELKDVHIDGLNDKNFAKVRVVR